MALWWQTPKHLSAGFAAATAAVLASQLKEASMAPSFLDRLRVNPTPPPDASAAYPASDAGSQGAAAAPAKAPPTPNPNPNPRNTAAGFDPEALERGAKALRVIEASPHSKQVMELMQKQEETRVAEEKSRIAQYQAETARNEVARVQAAGEEQRKNLQAQAQTKAQMARYEDELARQRMVAEHEQQRRRNEELVALQAQAQERQEHLRRSTEEQVQAERRRTEQERALLERETVRVKALAEAEGRAVEAKMAEEVNRRMLVEKLKAEQEKLLSAINTTFGHIGAGVRSLLTDRDKMVVAVGGGTALAAGVYFSREGARVLWGYVNRILGQPSLVRESSRNRLRLPWQSPGGGPSAAALAGGGSGSGGGAVGGAGALPAAAAAAPQAAFSQIVLPPVLRHRLHALASGLANTRKHRAPFQNMLFYGPPGTGKTLAARELARTSGLEYALMTGGDVVPLGGAAVTKLHEVFDWAKRSRRGVLLFIDEADAFLRDRNSPGMSEAQRSALNAVLYRTGDQSHEIVLVLATNRPEDLDRAVTDRTDEILEFPLPGLEERKQLLALYLGKYVIRGEGPKGWLQWLGLNKPPQVQLVGVGEELLAEVAAQTEGFSGRELAKLMASVRAATFASKEGTLTEELLRAVVAWKIGEHKMRVQLKDAAPGSTMQVVTTGTGAVELPEEKNAERELAAAASS